MSFTATVSELWNNHLDQPREVSIETLARCNAACTFCPYPTLERIGTKMPDELIDRLIGEMATWTVPFTLAPFKVNEPLLDVRLKDICNKFERDVPCGSLRLFSNGAPLIQKHVDWINKLERLVHLWVSFNEHDPVKYQALMGIPQDRTLKNLDALHKQVVAGDFRHDVVVSAVAPTAEFFEFCMERWPSFNIFGIKKDAWINFTDAQNPRIPATPCVRWFELNICATGEVALCCMHDGQDKQWMIGDLNKQSMLEVYNSPKWRDRRERLLSRKHKDLRDPASPCGRCSY